MDKDDEDKQPPSPKRRSPAARRGTRKRSGGKAGADALASGASKKSAGTDTSARKTRVKASGGKSTRAPAAKVGASKGKKSSATGVSAKKSGERRIQSGADPRLSRSLEYGVTILESFSGDRQTLGIADIADIVDVSRSTTHRYAMTLVELGYLEQDTKRKYRLARGATDPGAAAIGTVRREVAARAVLEELRQKTGHTVGMGILDGARVIYIHRLFAHGPGQYLADHDLGVGAGIPAYCSALGKILLASISEVERRELFATVKLKRHGPNTIVKRNELVEQLDRIRTGGVAVSDEELFAGSRSIATLIQRPRTEHPAAIEVTVPSSVYTVEQLRRRIGPRLKRAAKQISGA